MVFIFSLSILVLDLFLHPAGQFALPWLVQNNAGRAFLLLGNEHCSLLSFVAARVESARTVGLSPLSNLWMQRSEKCQGVADEAVLQLLRPHEQ